MTLVPPAELGQMQRKATAPLRSCPTSRSEKTHALCNFHLRALSLLWRAHSFPEIWSMSQFLPDRMTWLSPSHLKINTSKTQLLLAKNQFLFLPSLFPCKVKSFSQSQTFPFLFAPTGIGAPPSSTVVSAPVSLTRILLHTPPSTWICPEPVFTLAVPRAETVPDPQMPARWAISLFRLTIYRNFIPLFIK